MRHFGKVLSWAAVLGTLALLHPSDFTVAAALGWLMFQREISGFIRRADTLDTPWFRLRDDDPKDDGHGPSA